MLGHLPSLKGAGTHGHRAEALAAPLLAGLEEAPWLESALRLALGSSVLVDGSLPLMYL